MFNFHKKIFNGQSEKYQLTIQRAGHFSQLAFFDRELEKHNHLLRLSKTQFSPLAIGAKSLQISSGTYNYK